jgi:hypothetical protein
VGNGDFDGRSHHVEQWDHLLDRIERRLCGVESAVHADSLWRRAFSAASLARARFATFIIVFAFDFARSAADFDPK